MAIPDVSGYAPGFYPVGIVATSAYRTYTLSVELEIIEPIEVGVLTLNLPSNGKLRTNAPTFEWSEATGATSYLIEISQTPAFEKIK